MGYSVSQSGDILAVGAYLSDQDGMNDAGAAYLYRLESNGTATYLTKVTAPDKVASDRFGFSVSQSDDILAVGAYLSDQDGMNDAGAAYLYRLESNGTATYLTKVTAPDKVAGDRFGYSVSQSDDILAVGAYLSDQDGMNDAGAAYLYRLESNDTATYLTKVTAPDKAAIDYFGKSVSQSGDIFAVSANIIPTLMELLMQELLTPSTFPTMCRRSTVRLFPLGPGCRSTMPCMRILLWMRR